MKAITVVPKTEGSLEYGDVPEPTEASGSILVEAVGVGVCGTDVRDRHRQVRLGAAGARPAGARARVARAACSRRPRVRAWCPATSSWASCARPDPVPCPSCAVGEWDMCRNGAVHRARHQGDRRVHERALAHRARLRHQARPVARDARRAARADDGRHQGVGAGRRSCRGARSPSRGPRWSPAPDRSACSRRCSACSAASTSTCSTGWSPARSPTSSRTSGRRTTRWARSTSASHPTS